MLSSQKTSDAALDACVARLLHFVQRQARRNPDVVYGDGVERTLDTPGRRGFCRKLAAEGMVVLKNDRGVLPIKGGRGRKVKVALIGPNMKERVISGGGSAALKPSYVITPYDGLVANAPKGVEFEYEVGAYGRLSPLLFSGAGAKFCCSLQVPPHPGESLEDSVWRAWLDVFVLQTRCSRKPDWRRGR